MLMRGDKGLLHFPPFSFSLQLPWPSLDFAVKLIEVDTFHTW